MNKEIIVPKILLPYYYSWKIDNKSTNYNVCFSYELEKDISTVKFKETIYNLVSKRPNLRANFKFKNNQIKYVVHKNLEPIFHDLKVTTAAEYNHAIEKLTKESHNLHDESLIKISIIKREYNEDMIVLFNIHHAIIDGTSLDKFLTEISKVYNGEEISEESDERHLSSLLIQAKNTEYIEDKKDLKINNYINLLNKIASESEKFNIKQDEKIISSSQILNDLIYKKITNFSNLNKISIFNILLTSWCIFEAKLFNKDSLIVNYPVNIRNDKDETGCIINNINYPFIYNCEISFNKTIENIKGQMPLLKKLHYLNAMDIFDKNDSYYSHFAYSGFAKLKDLTLDHKTIHPTPYPQMAKSAFGMKYIKSDDKLYFLSEIYNNILPSSISDNLVDRYTHFLEKILDQPDLKLSETNILYKKEFNEIVYKQNNTNKDIIKNVSLPSYISSIVDKYPNKIAAIDEESSITYSELNEKSNQLAKTLINNNVSKNDVIAILMDNRIEMLVGILAVLKIGSIYLPISPDTPKDRIEYILKDSNAKKLLSTKELYNNSGINFDFIDLYKNNYHNICPSDLNIEVSNENIAYVIYTSGSTGNPKGVLVKHKSIVNLIEHSINRFDLSSEDSISKYSSFSFDASVIEIFSSLLSGATLHFVPNKIKFDIYKLNDFFNENNITFAFLTTKLAEIFMNLENKSLKNLLLGGEKLKYFKKTSYNITNAYGPTETSVIASMHPIECLSENIPIGKPIQNAKIYILNNDLNPCPYSLEGEIYIGGEILAQSYLNRKNLTDNKFIPNPFQTKLEKENGLNSRLYKTGDIGKKLKNGDILISGRTDFQVKIFGFRIELNEIEKNISDYPDIKNVVVTTFNDKNDHKYLCAYYDARKKIEAETLREFIKNNLPHYMIPKFFIQTESLPINYNGKIDLKSLKEPNIKKLQTKNYVAPSNLAEKMIANDFREILNCEEISIHDDFFILGGNSIKAIMLLSKLQKKFKIDISQIFQFKTIYNLAARLEVKNELNLAS